MTDHEALNLIESALKKVIKRDVRLTPDMDLIAGEILDSLDSMVFALEVENLSGKKFPEDIDLVEAGYYKVARLIDFVTG
jgi:acyl carrier protein